MPFMDERSTDTNRATGGGAGKGAVILLIVVVLMLSVGLWLRHTKAEKRSQNDIATITQLSNQVVAAKQELEEQRQVNTRLETDLGLGKDELKKISSTLTQTVANLARTEAEAKKAQEQFQKEMAARDARIGELEGQRDDLTKRMTELNGSIENLETAIAATQKKLDASEGDRAFLLKELKRLQAEKMELERQFNDLAMLRDQVKKLKDELSISRRLEWLRKGIYGTPKSVEKLQKPLTSTNRNFDLNVELKQDKSVIVNPPATNAAPRPTPPAPGPGATPQPRECRVG
jgi:chromosome segregation ATPase